jgi:hypothetical protein
MWWATTRFGILAEYMTSTDGMLVFMVHGVDDVWFLGFRRLR